MKAKVLAIATGFALLMVGACSSTSDPTPGEQAAIVSVQNAITGNPDAMTLRAMQSLNTTLTQEELQYAANLDWSKLDADNIKTDPVLSKAIAALSAQGFAETDGGLPTSSTPSSLTLHPDLFPGAEPVSGFSSDFFADLVQVMAGCFDGKTSCHGEACVGAALAWTILNYGGLGFPGPAGNTYADQGEWQCTESFFGKGSQTADCDFKPFCATGTLVFPGGTFTCNDPGYMAPAPHCPSVADLLARTTNNSSGSGGGSGDGTPAPCQMSDGQWFSEACAKLYPQHPVAWACYPANAAFGVTAPRLPNGDDPSKTCTQEHNADGLQSSLVQAFNGCDPTDTDYAGGCWCCAQ